MAQKSDSPEEMEKRAHVNEVSIALLFLLLGFSFGLFAGNQMYPADGIKRVDLLLVGLSTIERPDSLMTAAKRASTPEVQAALYEKANGVRVHRDSTIANVERVFKSIKTEVPLVVREYINRH